MATITADASGVVKGKFRIPPNVTAGAKRVDFAGSGGSRGSQTFVGEGTLVSQTYRNVTTVVESRWQVDPLAQTFTLENSCQIGGVDLWFVKKGSTDVLVQIRETTAGFPNRRVIGECRLDPSVISVSGGHTRAVFPGPVSVLGGTEYAIVVLCDDAVTECAVAEVGKWDAVNARWITAQPYQIGTLLSSSNASTWTAHQNMDLTFRLLRAQYTATDKVVELGEMDVSELSDVMVLGFAENPTAQARVEWQLGIPGGATVTVQEAQPVRLDTAATGKVKLSARLIGNADSAPVLWPGTQLVRGKVQSSADYIIRAIQAGAGTKVRVIFDANLSGDAKVGVKLQPATADPADAASWTAVPYHASSPGVEEGWFEFEHTVETSAEMIRVKLELSGSSRFRPRVKNLRVVTV